MVGVIAAVLAMACHAGACAQGISVENDIEFSTPDNQHLLLNLARPSTGSGPFPAVICIHGGGFRAGDRHGYDGLIKRFAERGYVAATAEYRLAPKYQFPAQVYVVKASKRKKHTKTTKNHKKPNQIGVT